jgi:NUDIX domain.
MLKKEFPPFVLEERKNGLHIKHPGASVILMRDGEGRIAIVSQYREVIDEVTLELPAGKLENGEEPMLGALREAREETGFLLEKANYLTSFQPDRSFTDETLHVFAGEKGEKKGQNLDYDEALEPVFISPLEVLAAIRAGRITDMKTIIAVAYAIHSGFLYPDCDAKKSGELPAFLKGKRETPDVEVAPNYLKVRSLLSSGVTSLRRYLNLADTSITFAYEEGNLYLKEGEEGERLATVVPSAALSNRRLICCYSPFRLEGMKKYPLSEAFESKEGNLKLAAALYLIFSEVGIAG